MFILEENYFEKFVKEEDAKPEGDEAKANFKKNMIRAKRIIADSIKDHLIPHVSSLDTPRCLKHSPNYLKERTLIGR